MKYCSVCGQTVTLQVPPGDNRPRHCCAGCGTIHYQNPRMVVGTIPVYGSRVLLCKRAIEPRYGYWTLPAGFMENGETVSDGALRETIEEAGAQVEMGALYSMIDVPHVQQVHLFYRATVLDERFDPGDESLEVRLYEEHEVPWEQIAFQTVARTLRWYFDDRRRDRFELHTGAVQPRASAATVAGS